MNLENTGIFLAVAVVTAIVCRRLKLPYTVGLVLAGIGVAFSPFQDKPVLTKDLVFTLFLPPLVFEAAFMIKWKEFKQCLGVVSTMATVGLLLSAAVVTGAMVLMGWPLAAALVFAILISATDPVSVIATMKEAGVSGRLRTMVESESLLNDGTAAVAFGLAVAFGMTGEFSFGHALLEFCLVAFGGILIGGLVGGLCLLVAGRTDDHLVEVAISTLAAFGSFLIAEEFGKIVGLHGLHLSGVLATVTAGIMLGNLGEFGSITMKGHGEVESFWDFAAFLANSFVFLLIGIQEAHENFSAVLVALAVAVLAVLAGRAVTVYGVSALYCRAASRLRTMEQHVMFWGGLRGALALALALSLPEGFPMKGVIQTVTAGVVAFSVVIQGITITPLLKKAAADDSEARISPTA